MLMVVAGVGRNSEDPKFQEVLINLATSRDSFFKARFDNLDNILNKLVAKSCVQPGRSLSSSIICQWTIPL